MKEMKEATMQEMMDNLVPIHVRDSCANVLIPLNKCRRKNMYMVWHCVDERHSYEVCLYKQYEQRREIQNKLNEERKQQELKKKK